MASKALEVAADLRYLEADNVRCPAGNLAEFRVYTADAEPLGSVSGVLINPANRRCEFFVIESRGMFSSRRLLLPIETGAIVEEEPKALKIPARKDELDLETFTPSSVPQFSDEDLLTAMFSQDAA